MGKLRTLLALLFALVCHSAFVVAPGAAQTQSAQQPTAKAEDKTKQGARDEALRKYAGRYELEVGIIPISTLDVTVADGELWMKPSVVKKRRLVRKSRATFTDEVEGTPVNFNRDDDGHVASLTFVFEGESYTARRVELPSPSLKGNTKIGRASCRERV